MQTVYVGNTLINDVMLGSQRMDDVFTNPLSPIPLNGLLTWLKPESYTSGSSQWLSYTGSVAATASLNGATSLPNWNTSSFTFTHTQTMNLEPYTSFDLTSVSVESDYTIIYFGRFNGAEGDKHGRILTGGHYGQGVTSAGRNWTMGTEGTNTEAWTTYGTLGSVGYIYGPTGSYDTNWRMYAGVCDRLVPSSNTTFTFYINDEMKVSNTYNASGNTGPYSVGINTGSFLDGTAGGRENNNCVVGDILIYDRVLSDSEIKNIYAKLGPKFGLV